MSDVAAFLALVTQREVIVALAILGALLTAYGSYAFADDAAARRKARIVVLSGYTVTGSSVLAFIVAGFLADS